MKNLKNTLFRIPSLAKGLLGLSGILIIGSGILLANAQDQAVTFSGLHAQYLDRNFSKGHMANAGNDFGAGFFWLPSKDLGDTPVKLSIGSETYTCKLQVRGFYYNSQRGARLWALDQESQNTLKRSNSNYTQGNISGGWFTQCSYTINWKQQELPYGIYGYITHDDTAITNQKFYLYAGIQYNINQNTVEPKFACNLQRINNSYPIGLFFDTAGGVGLLGMSIKSENINSYQDIYNKLSSKCMETQFSFNGEKLTHENDNRIDIGLGDAKATIFQLGIRGIVWLSTEINPDEQKGFDGNQFETSLIVNTESSISNIMNAASKKAEALCRGKWSNSIGRDTLICLSQTNGNKWEWEISDYEGKTIIVKNGNLTLTKYMSENSQPTTIFINKGNLYLPTNSTPNIAFLANGYLGSDEAWITANYLKGNFIINGLLQGKGNQGIENKLVIHGKVASFNTLLEPSGEQKWNIFSKIGQDDNNLKVGLNTLFTRTCENGTGSDNTKCLGVKSSDPNANFITNKAFNLIDMNFSSPLFQ